MGRIILEITDNHKFKDLALLLDNPNFQRDLIILKKAIERDWKKYPDLASHLLNSRVGGKAQALTQKYKYPRGFTRAIMAAAENNKVTDSDVINCYSAVLMQPTSLLDEYKPILTKSDFVVFIDPQAIRGNKKAILRQFSTLLDEAAKNIKPLSKKHPLRRDAKTVIERDREWYWMWVEEKKQGKGIYARILEKWNNLCPNINLEPHEKECKHCIFDTNVIERAVSRYVEVLRY
ncbi:hypothetical protein C4577_00385 [Candidatus Parcubacteria bacterium]|nr:MAG: hypothetical protein C4577_00385 [Candidatus Parcubacteria bacterium]